MELKQYNLADFCIKPGLIDISIVKIGHEIRTWITQYKTLGELRSKIPTITGQNNNTINNDKFVN